MTNYRKQQSKYIIVDLISSIVVWLCFLFFRWLVYEGKMFTIDTVLIPAFDFYLAPYVRATFIEEIKKCQKS